MKKTNIRKLIYRIRHHYLTLNNVVLAVGLLVAVSWAWGSVDKLEQNYALQKQVDAKQREQQLLELENQTLAYQQRYYKSDEYKELAVRERLGLALPGEKALVLPPNSAAAKASETTSRRSTDSTSKPSNIEQWINFLFGGNSRQLH